MSTRPSTLRQLVRNSQEFANCLNPLLEESLPVVSPNTKVKTLYLSSFLVNYPIGQESPSNVAGENDSKPNSLKSKRRLSTTRIPNKRAKFTSAVNNNTDENVSSSKENNNPTEVYLSYNDSNTPKHIGKFFNVMVNNRLKRQCKYCHLQYADLKGFNRHYEKKHARR
ncbi:hypothetical protein FOB58_004145 [Candida parapsilosis]|uniref:C2H2-type domain-containing protein n=2 Tax=Candida parapsilosis TaxID=5480 RepID=A0AAJ8W453_CANPC|nr:hypothetical protein FOB58_004145 [Candida parapsilosis]KAF6046739.1 hypothetical protein FOB59_004204 [Candida parapsilosis]KAF6050820.1 hypothetical protein FOB60_003488 [Candida parapsilosis]KAF6062458.1 hypothetical protein FOB61_003888 [Candida parapsilosis]KAI5905093.1 hypothetical protein K4G60_g4351 [Candida parapsilosis]